MALWSLQIFFGSWSFYLIRVGDQVGKVGETWEISHRNRNRNRYGRELCMN